MDSQESYPTPQFKSISSSALSFLYGPILTSIHDYRKNHSYDIAQSWMWLVMEDSAHEGYHMIFLFLCLTYFTQNDNLQFCPCYCKGHYFILFNGWVIFHCTYEPHFHHPFLCWWPFRLLLCLCYCKQHCKEHWGTYILSDHVFLQIYLGHGI